MVQNSRARSGLCRMPPPTASAVPAPGARNYATTRADRNCTTVTHHRRMVTVRRPYGVRTCAPATSGGACTIVPRPRLQPPAELALRIAFAQDADHVQVDAWA